MSYEIKRVAMTGGSGPIGLALIKYLLSEEIEILLFQREHSAKRMYLPESDKLHIEFTDLKDICKWKPCGEKYDVFFHLGWTNTNSDGRNDISMQLSNVHYTCDVVELAAKLGCHTFLGVGSQAEYGRKNELLREDTACTPETAYGIVKLCADYAAEFVCKKNGMRFLWPRVFSAYGVYDNINSVLISSILKSMDHQPLIFSKAEQIWEFVYLDDVARALFLIAKEGRDGVRYPLSSGDARPLRDFIEVMCKKLGVQPQFGIIPYGDNQIMRLEADISTLQADTGWEPQVAFEEGIERVIEFYNIWKPRYGKIYLQLRKEVEGK